MSSQGQKFVEAQAASYQPSAFSFDVENFAKAEAIIAKYPAGRQQSALMPLLSLAQAQNANWLPVAAMDYVASMLGIPPMRAYEVATFYTMYNLKPIGRHFIEVCTTTPCWLRGSDDIVKACKEELGIGIGETTEDGQFTLVEAECLAACVNAPMIQIGEHYYEDLSGDSMRGILRDLRAGKAPKPGPQNGRRNCEPLGGMTTLKETVKPQKETVKKPNGGADAPPNTPAQDEPKGRPKSVRQPIVDEVPTTEEAEQGKSPNLAKPKSTPVKSAPKKK